MKLDSAQLKAHYALTTAQGGQTTAQCLAVTLTNGDTLFFTDNDRNIVIAGWVGTAADLNGTYLAASGFLSTAVQTSSAMNVDNTELEGPQVNPAILEAALVAGTWDNAAFILFEVNRADLTMGPHYLRRATIGEVTVEAGRFKAEVRGMMQAYTKTLCELTSPGCRANLGDSRCNADLTAFTVTGTLTAVNADNTTVYDTGRAEAGPSAGVAITGITNANPGVVTLADASLNLVNGQAITIAGVVGMAILNVVTIVHNPSGNTFELSVDTTDTAAYGTYTSGGTVTPFSGTGGTSGFFDGGKITYTSGLNAGLSYQVKSYVPGQITQALPASHLLAIGNTYTMIAGCDKSLQTCRDIFNNVVNFVGEPYLAGIDKLVQVGRHA